MWGSFVPPASCRMLQSHVTIQADKADKSGPGFPPLAYVVGLIAAAVTTYVGNRGPHVALQEIAEAFGHREKPKIVALRQTKKEARAFNVSIENPSLRQIQIVGYYASPIWIPATATVEPMTDGGLTLMEAGDDPVPCDMALRFHLERPLIIEPGTARGLTIRPWNEDCEFVVRVEGTTGVSDVARWAPETDAVMRAYER